MEEVQHQTLPKPPKRYSTKTKTKTTKTTKPTRPNFRISTKGIRRRGQLEALQGKVSPAGAPGPPPIDPDACVYDAHIYDPGP